jgi:WD40 repeat protein
MKFQPYDFALGVKSLEFSKRGDILAVGSYDEKVRLINLVSLRLITELDHKPQLTQYKDIIVYKEEEFKDKFAGQKLITKCTHNYGHRRQCGTSAM